MADRAQAIVKHHIGGRVRGCEPLTGGITNHVFRVRHDGGAVIVRLASKGGRLEAFLKEQWACERAREAGVPAVRVLEVGSDVIDTPYMIEEAADGASACKHEDRIGIITRFGSMAASIHEVETHGFGETFDWSRNELSRCESWGDYLTETFDWKGRLKGLSEAGVLDAGRARAVRATFETLAGETPAPALNHGDLRLKNVLVDEDGEICALLDWEDCQSNAPRLWDLSLALHDLGVDEKEAFLKGYGMAPNHAIQLASGWAALNVAMYSGFVEQAHQAGDEEKLGWFRARMAGTFDLYSV